MDNIYNKTGDMNPKFKQMGQSTTMRCTCYQCQCRKQQRETAEVCGLSTEEPHNSQPELLEIMEGQLENSD